MEKLEITKFIYQKTYFNSIISQTILDNPFILEKQNIFDKKTLHKLISELKEETEKASDISKEESLKKYFYLGVESEEDERKKFFKNLGKLIQCKSLEEIMHGDEEKGYDFWYEMYNNHKIFKDPIEVFQEKNIGNLNYFHLKIKIFIGGNGWNYCYIYDYLFYKTKGNKYLFKTKFKEEDFNCYDEYTFNWSETSIRYCKTKRFEDYYFINNKIQFDEGCRIIQEQYDPLNYYLYFKEFNTVKFCGENDPKFFDSFFEKNLLVNKLEKIQFGSVDEDEDEELDIIKSIKKCPKLKCFIIDDFRQIKLLIELLRTLSSLKSLFLIDISYKGKLELNENEKKEINELFPCLSIVIKENNSSLKWKYGTKIKRFRKKFKIKKLLNKK